MVAEVEERLERMRYIRKMIDHPVMGMEARGRWDAATQNFVPFSQEEIEDARAEADQFIARMEELLSGETSGLDTPLGVPNLVNYLVEQIEPRPGWVMVEEEFSDGEVEIGEDFSIKVVKPYKTNTMVGQVVKASPSTLDYLGIGTSDKIVYREWQGARWNFAGTVVLLLWADHVLAAVED